MVHSRKPIITYIPLFLEYCKKEKNLSAKTIKNYSRFLKYFVDWLQQSNLTELTPQDLILNIIQKYKNYLSQRTSPKTKQPLSKTTQNCYLTGLRALLSYFSAKNIDSLSPKAVKLTKTTQKKKTVQDKIDTHQLKELLDSKSSGTIFIEVGTVSLFKLWYNLLTVKDCTFLIVPSEKYLIEFKNNYE